MQGQAGTPCCGAWFLLVRSCCCCPLLPEGTSCACSRSAARSRHGAPRGFQAIPRQLLHRSLSRCPAAASALGGLVSLSPSGAGGGGGCRVGSGAAAGVRRRLPAGSQAGGGAAGGGSCRSALPSRLWRYKPAGDSPERTAEPAKALHGSQGVRGERVRSGWVGWRAGGGPARPDPHPGAPAGPPRCASGPQGPWPCRSPRARPPHLLATVCMVLCLVYGGGRGAGLSVGAVARRCFGLSLDFAVLCKSCAPILSRLALFPSPWAVQVGVQAAGERPGPARALPPTASAAPALPARSRVPPPCPL